jgi:serpin B
MILICALAISTVPTLAETAAITVNVDGTVIHFPDAQPFIDKSNRTQIPIGSLAQVLNAKTDWDETTRTAHIIKNSDVIKIIIGDDKLYKGTVSGDGAYTFADAPAVMDTVAVIERDRTFIPVRYAADALGFSVEWNSASHTVNLASAVQVSNQASFIDGLLESMPKDKNYMISPFSLKMAFAMVANGADGETRRQILDTLNISDLGQFNADAKAFISNANQNNTVEYNIANSIWMNTDYYKDSELKFSDAYKDTISGFYNGIVSEINNANGKKTINDWIAVQTKDRIKDVINDDDVKEVLSFLVNTIYFKGEWAGPFNEKLNREGIFTNRDGTQKSTEFMNETWDFSYFENNEFQVLAKPYEDYHTRMYFVLPKTDKSITKAEFDYISANMKSEYVHFTLPKFKTEYSWGGEPLINTLEKMGIITAFDRERANLLNMYSKRPPQNIYINTVIQKTFISVDETGTEAAAATVLGGGGGSSAPPPKPIEFKCDRPFTYFITDDSADEILFAGEYAYVE